MFRLKELDILCSKAELASLPDGKLLINTINAHSYNTARKDKLFAEALMNGDVLIPDGVSIVKAASGLRRRANSRSVLQDGICSLSKWISSKEKVLNVKC